MSKLMKAIQFNAKTKELKLKELPIPEVKLPTDVIIKVAFAGVCGTDLHIMQGEFKCDQNSAFTLGHEFSGTVVAIGSSVTNVAVGDAVAVDPNNGCDRCKYCNDGNPHFCEVGGLRTTVGIYRDGGWAQYCSVPDAQIHLLPNTISLRQGALSEPLSCLAHGWDMLVPLPVGKRILVLGSGIIGNLWVAALHHQGHRDVTVSEPNAARRALTEKLETGYKLITPGELRQDDKYDVIIDCSGHPGAIEHAFGLLDKGGRLCIFGVAPPHAKIQISPFDMFSKELTILGVQINPFTFNKAIGLSAAMGDRYLEYNRLGVKMYALHEYAEAIEALKQGSIAKAMFAL